MFQLNAAIISAVFVLTTTSVSRAANASEWSCGLEIEARSLVRPGLEGERVDVPLQLPDTGQLNSQSGIYSASKDAYVGNTRFVYTAATDGNEMILSIFDRTEGEGGFSASSTGGLTPKGSARLTLSLRNKNAVLGSKNVVLKSVALQCWLK